MSDDPIHVGGVVCICRPSNPLDPDVSSDHLAILDLDCPIHGTKASWATVGGKPDLGEWVPPTTVVDEPRLWEPVRQFKFSIFEPVNQDVTCLKFIKYEYMRSWNEDWINYITKDPHSFVFCIDEAGDGYWYEFHDYETLNTEHRLPHMNGIDEYSHDMNIRNMNLFWEAALNSINEREDYYQKVWDSSGPHPVVNAPTEQQIQEVIDERIDYSPQFDESDEGGQ